MERRVVGDRHVSASEAIRGFTLAEVLVAVFLVALVVLGAAPMFIQAQRGNATAGDLGAVGAKATERLELLREQDYDDLSPGGSLTANATGYFDAADPEVLVRWTIADNATPPETRRITVRAVALRQLSGPARSLTVQTLRGD
jgi:prepilin-type N-terminal cleavage/methylation domain-containing protein